MLRYMQPQRSIGAKLVILFLISSIVPMLILTLVINNLASENMRTIAQERMLAQVNASVDRLDRFLAERQTDARVIASLPDTSIILQRDATSEAYRTSHNIIRRVRDIYGFSAISVLDTDGRVVMSTDQALQGRSRGERGEVIAALDGNIAVSDAATDPEHTTVWIHITAPVYDEQLAIIGVIDIRILLDRLVSLIDLDTGQAGAGSYGVLLDEQLIRIAHPAHPAYQFRPAVPLSDEVKQELVARNRFGDETASVLEQETNLVDLQQSIETMTQSGESAIFFAGQSASTGEMTEAMMKKLTTTNWYYLYRVPEASFYAVVATQNRYALTTTLIAAFLAASFMIIFSRATLGKPLVHLVEVAGAIAQGDLHRRPSVRQRDEIGELAHSFTIMTENLQRRIVAEEEALQTAQQLQESEASSRRFLEQTVSSYKQFAEQVASGSLHQRLQVASDGVLGELGKGLNTMVAELQQMNNHIQQANTNITSTVTRILEATTQQAASTTQQSSAVSETTTTVEEIKNIAQQVAQQASTVARDSERTLAVAREGSEAVAESVSSMRNIHIQMGSIAQTILTLSERTQAIGGITRTVSELADQSNMLALNAAIEAARAGEQGRSFAVVADQVRKLAERSKVATVQVQEILNEIQHVTNNAVMVTEEGTKQVEEGVKLSDKAGTVIQHIATEIEHTVHMNTQMAAAFQQQKVGIEQIGQAMYAIQQATQQVLESTNQTEDAARDLSGLSQSLQEAIKRLSADTKYG